MDGLVVVFGRKVHFISGADEANTRQRPAPRVSGPTHSSTGTFDTVVALLPTFYRCRRVCVRVLAYHPRDPGIPLYTLIRLSDPH